MAHDRRLALVRPLRAINLFGCPAAAAIPDRRGNGPRRLGREPHGGCGVNEQVHVSSAATDQICLRTVGQAIERLMRFDLDVRKSLNGA